VPQVSRSAARSAGERDGHAERAHGFDKAGEFLDGLARVAMAVRSVAISRSVACGRHGLIVRIAWRALRASSR